MTNTKSNKKPSVTINVANITPNTKLTYVNKNGAEHNINRAKKVGGYTYANALAYYKSIGYGKTDLNYDIRGGRLIVS
jgi:hypothetical protein|tara:strand:- start:7518 stop:7751 length:234 start_codon:yes stop_codon:yes gene_type:complete